MRKFVFGFLLGIIAGVAGYWYYSEGQKRDLKQDLTRSGEAVEQKAKKAGAAIADAATNAKTTAAVKARLSKELGLGALAEISVDTTDGLVTLSGSVSSREDIDKAVKIAAETEGVSKVISTLQVKAPK
jgi:hyperosmotically inducible periplasmic protein